MPHLKNSILLLPAVSGSAPPFSVEALSLLDAMPFRFSLGQILEEAERRGETARQGYLYLQAFIDAGWVRDEGQWLMKMAD
ncbi:MAG: hypothetical protein ACR2GR_10575 [Rhodothermales bacterium]